jgi:hypothetical protein
MGVQRLALATILIAASLHANGADIRSELDSCRSIQGLGLRLQCYDQLVDSIAASGISTVVPDQVTPVEPTFVSAPVPVRPSVLTPATSAVEAADQKIKVAPEELFGKSAQEVEEAVSRELDIESVDEISSEVTRVRINQAGEYIVYLANSQIWRQKDKVGKWRIKVGETAIVSKAALGSFRMKSNTRKKSVRAERLR